jgi:hypothetical protein
MNVGASFSGLTRRRTLPADRLKDLISQYTISYPALDPQQSVLCLKSLGALNSKQQVDLNRAEIRDVVELSLSDISRNCHKLTPRDVCDVLCVDSNKYLISRLLHNLDSFSVRQLSLCVWGLGKRTSTNSPSADSSTLPQVYPTTISHILDNPHRIMEGSTRDWALLLYTGCRKMSSFPSLESHTAQLVRIVDYIVTDSVKFKSSQELSLVVYSLGVLRGTLKSIQSDTSIVDSAANHVIPQISELIHRRRTQSQPIQESVFSTRSLLASLCGLSKLKFRAHPLLTDLYRILYNRVDGMTANQCAHAFYLFSCESGLLDGDVRDRFFSGIRSVDELSNTNLINTLLGLRRVKNIEQSEPFFAHAKLRKFSPDQLVTLIECAVELMENRPPSILEFWHAVLPPRIGVLKHFDAKNLVKLYVCQRKLGLDSNGIKNAISVALIHRLKKNQQWGSEELVMFANELSRVISGPYSAKYHPVKPNLKSRFFRHLWISVKHRRIPTNILMNNLIQIDQIGTFKRLPYDLQMHLWNKAQDHQKAGMSEPRPPTETPNSWRRRLMESKQLLVKIPTREERKAMWLKYEEDRKKAIKKADTEEMEIAKSPLAKAKTPISEFIDTLRRQDQ